MPMYKVTPFHKVDPSSIELPSPKIIHRLPFLYANFNTVLGHDITKSMSDGQEVSKSVAIDTVSNGQVEDVDTVSNGQVEDVDTVSNGQVVNQQLHNKEEKVVKNQADSGQEKHIGNK